MNQEREPIHRSRVLYLVLVLIIISLGIASRHNPSMIPGGFGKYPGDVLWTVTVYLILGLIFTRTSSLRIALLALFISYIDEISQLYQATWIWEIRRSYLGHLFLGSLFAWADLAAYTIGAMLAFTVEKGSVMIKSALKSR